MWTFSISGFLNFNVIFSACSFTFNTFSLRFCSIYTFLINIHNFPRYFFFGQNQLRTKLSKCHVIWINLINVSFIWWSNAASLLQANDNFHNKIASHAIFISTTLTITVKLYEIPMHPVKWMKHPVPLQGASNWGWILVFHSLCINSN